MLNVTKEQAGALFRAARFGLFQFENTRQNAPAVVDAKAAEFGTTGAEESRNVRDGLRALAEYVGDERLTSASMPESV